MARLDPKSLRSLTRRRRIFCGHNLVFLTLLLLWVVAASAGEQDLYKLLGVSKTATVKEIKQVRWMAEI